MDFILCHLKILISQHSLLLGGGISTRWKRKVIWLVEMHIHTGMKKIPRKTNCVDDTVLWDEELADYWWCMIEYLELMGNNGVVLNPRNSSLHKNRWILLGLPLLNAK